jgi:hypothetical protein
LPKGNAISVLKGIGANISFPKLSFTGGAPGFVQSTWRQAHGRYETVGMRQRDGRLVENRRTENE